MSMEKVLLFLVLVRLSISMDSICKYSKITDLGEASQSGAVDLSELLAHGVVPSNLNVTAESFNDIEDPKAVFGRPSDQFEAISMTKTLNARAKAAQAVKESRES